MSKFAKDELKKCTFLDMELYSQKLSYFNHLPKINPLLVNFCQKRSFLLQGKKKEKLLFPPIAKLLEVASRVIPKAPKNFSFLSYG